jgi:hypothetical protein
MAESPKPSKQFDDVLRRLLKMRPQPHEPKSKAQKFAKKKPAK